MKFIFNKPVAVHRYFVRLIIKHYFIKYLSVAGSESFSSIVFRSDVDFFVFETVKE